MSLTRSAASGSQTLSGANPNAYTGPTTVTGGGVLRLAKTAGVTSLPTSFTISAGGKVVLPTANRIADAATVTMSGAGSVFNGAGPGAGTGTVAETVVALTAAGGAVKTGSVGPGASNGFTLFGASATQTKLTVGALGLTLNHSVLNLRRDGATGDAGRRLALDGDVTTTGSAPPPHLPRGGRRDGQSGNGRPGGDRDGGVTRTFTVGGGQARPSASRR